MNLLRALETIRMPWLNEVMTRVTTGGEETVFLLVSMTVLWCIQKAWGFRFLLVELTGTVVNQILKAIFLIPRPWVIDPEFTIVESARSGATGYSFPSGHTQRAVSCFGTLAAWLKKKWVTAVCVALVAVVAFSRMYLGVHTPLDVGVSLVVGTANVLLVTWLLRKDEPGRIHAVQWGALAMAVVMLGYVLLAPKREANVAEFDLQGVKKAWQVMGATVALVLSWRLDEKYLHFETKAVWWAQILKVAIGLGLMAAVRYGLHPLLLELFNGAMFTYGLRYFLMYMVGFCLWPMTFRFWGKLGKHKPQAESDK